MEPNSTTLYERFTWLVRSALILLGTSLWCGVASADTVIATKTCSATACTVTEAQFTIYKDQVVDWQAFYAGNPQDFLVSSFGPSHPEFALGTHGQVKGSTMLYANPNGGAKTYHISIRTPQMGPGTYSVTFDPSMKGDTHIRTTNGIRYDMQGVGEFVMLRHADGLEIQTRQAPIPTTVRPGPDPYDGLAMCVSLNTAVAARVGQHRVTYESDPSGKQNPAGPQLRVDGVLTRVGPRGIDLGNGGRITNTSVQGGLKIDFPGQGALVVTPGWWADQKTWWLDLDVSFPPGAAVGIAADVSDGSWLPGLPNGASMGPMPSSLHDRYVDLYQKFVEAYRVTGETSLFDYAPGTSTETFTMRNWPPEDGPCTLPDRKPVQPASELVAEQACQLIMGEHEHRNCVFDVMATGHTGFARTYYLGQHSGTKTVRPKARGKRR